MKGKKKRRKKQTIKQTKKKAKRKGHVIKKFRFLACFFE